MRATTLTVFLAAIALILLPARAFAGEQASAPQQHKKPVTRSTKAKACAHYGPGFIQVEGTSTCVKVGGSVGFEAGTTRR
jgi:hypothetical protein